MLAQADRRSFSAADERFQPCAFCGRDLVVLPNDRRGGACFDCLSLIGPLAGPCPDCNAEIPADSRAVGCPTCGWGPRP
ncbi:MAG TPA: hypothetical protein VMH90_01150 [Thermoplasmata archaeon]|nr:hypothetical protein [Thermoplasmata archaeon]